MMRFKEFVQQGNMEEEKDDIQKTLSKLPQSHASLVHGYKWKFHPGNTLNGDSQHIGYVDDAEKEIAMAGAYNYPREFTVLHEVAHKVWERLPENLKHHWIQIASQNHSKDPSLDQEPEELFCQSYAQFYVKNKLLKFHNPQWMQFIKNLPQ